MLSLLLLTSTAMALELGGDIHALGTIESEDGAPNTLGLGGAVALGVHPQLSFEVMGQTAFGRSDPLEGAPIYLRLRPELRLYVTPPDAPLGGFSVVGGYGMAWGDGTFSPNSSIGLAMDFPWPEYIKLRLQTRYELQSPGGRAFLFTIGLSRRPGAPSPEPPLEPVVVAPPEPVSEPPSLPMSVEPADAMVWLPHPYCGWWPAEEASRVAVDLPPGSTLKFAATGYLPAQVTLADGPLQVKMEPAPDQGLLVVLSLPGDEVLLDGAPLEVDPRGVAVTTAPTGLHRVMVSGGGRQAELTATLSTGYIAWLRSPAPDPAVVRFGLGSSSLSASARSDIRDLAERAGGWHFELLG